MQTINSWTLFTGIFLLFFSASASAQDIDIRVERVGRIHNRATDARQVQSQQGQQSQASALRMMLDERDRDIYSPKSAHFSADGQKFYVNSLEGGKTLVYSWPEIKKLKTISHQFNQKNQDLFQGEDTVFNYPYYTKSKSGQANHFMGKPVESELSHGGRYLWVPYYRRSYDSSGQSPSAVAIVDTHTDEIVRVMPTGPIPKYVVASPDGRYIAIVHWGDNTVGFIDVRSNNVRDFRYTDLITVERKLSQADLGGTNRDKTCGFCLRGAVFSPDSRYLYVARMGGGGIAGIDVHRKSYLGTVTNIASTPRHIVLSADGESLLVSSNVSGVLSRVSVNHINGILDRLGGRRSSENIVEESISLGVGARTLDITSDGQVAFVALNNKSKIAMVHLPSFQNLGELDADPYPVGLAVSPLNDGFVVTSQGRNGVGGNSVGIYFYQRSEFGGKGSWHR